MKSFQPNVVFIFFILKLSLIPSCRAFENPTKALFTEIIPESQNEKATFLEINSLPGIINDPFVSTKSQINRQEERNLVGKAKLQTDPKELEVLMEAIKKKIPTSFNCVSSEKQMRCEDRISESITCSIKYDAVIVKTGQGNKKIMYLITLTNNLKEGEKPRDYHGTYRVKVLKDSNGTNLIQKLSWLFGTSSSDFSKVTLINDLKRNAPATMLSIISSDVINKIVSELLEKPNKYQNNFSMKAGGQCKFEAAIMCSVILYSVDDFCFRLEIRIGKTTANYAIWRDNFEDGFQTHSEEIKGFISAQKEKLSTKKDYPLANTKIITEIETVVTKSCTQCLRHNDIKPQPNLDGIYGQSFIYKRTINGKTEDQKIFIFGLHYDLEGWEYEHILFDSQDTQDELLLTTAADTFSKQFKTAFDEFLSLDYSHDLETGKEFIITADVIQTELNAAIHNLQSDCKVTKMEKRIGLKCNNVDVIEVKEIETEEDSGFIINFLVTIKNDSKEISETGFVLQTVNAFDQLREVRPKLDAYLKTVTVQLKSNWKIV